MILLSSLIRKFSAIKFKVIKAKLIQMLIILIQEKNLKLKYSITFKDESVAQIINSISSDLVTIDMLEYSYELISTIPKVIACIIILF